MEKFMFVKRFIVISFFVIFVMGCVNVIKNNVMEEMDYLNMNNFIMVIISFNIMKFIFVILVVNGKEFMIIV